MGCPEWHYRDMLVEYLRLNTTFTKLEKRLTQDKLHQLTTSELETLVKSFNRSNPMYSAYLCGSAVVNILNELDESGCTDGLNAACGSISMMEELFNIKCPENVDIMYEKANPILEKIDELKERIEEKDE